MTTQYREISLRRPLSGIIRTLRDDAVKSDSNVAIDGVYFGWLSNAETYSDVLYSVYLAHERGLGDFKRFMYDFVTVYDELARSRAKYFSDLETLIRTRSCVANSAW